MQTVTDRRQLHYLLPQTCAFNNRHEMTTGLRRRSWFYICFLYFLVSFVFLQTSHSANIRSKRNLMQFSNMIRIATGVSDPMRFNNYGNFCGAGSKNPDAPAVDEIDECCNQHDSCYSNLTSGPCYWANFGWSYSPYLNLYNWIVPNGNIVCVDSNNECKLATCNCDRIGAQCMAQHLLKYNEAHKQSNAAMRIIEKMWGETQRIFNWLF